MLLEELERFDGVDDIGHGPVRPSLLIGPADQSRGFPLAGQVEDGRHVDDLMAHVAVQSRDFPLEHLAVPVDGKSGEAAGVLASRTPERGRRRLPVASPRQTRGTRRRARSRRFRWN